jgi:hypothetical protein
MLVSEAEIIRRFRENYILQSSPSENLSQENILLGNFVRKELLTFSCNNVPFSEIIQYIETIFSLSESGKIDLNIPFLLIEDLIEYGSYGALDHLLLYLDAKSKLWVSVLFDYFN